MIRIVSLGIFLALSHCAADALADSPFRYSGTRCLSMGGAFVAVADDENAINWNPAGLARAPAPRAVLSGRLQRYPFELDWIDASFTYVEREAAASFLYRGFGASVCYSGRGWSDEIRVMCGGPALPGEFASGRLIYESWTAGVSYGYEIVERLSLGATARYIHFNDPGLELCNVSYEASDAFALDLGVLLRGPPKLTVGLAVHNIAANRFDHVLQSPIGPTAYVEELPIETNVGIAYRPIETLLIAVDVHNVFEDGVRAMYCGDELACKRSFHAGSEWQARPGLRLRGGYFRDARTLDTPCAAQTDVEYAWYDNFTFGFGAGYRTLSFDLGVWGDTRSSKIEELPLRVEHTTLSGSASISVAF